MSHSRTAPPDTSSATSPKPPRRRFADGTRITDDMYVLRPENRAYLRGFRDTPTLSGRGRQPWFVGTYILAAFVIGCVLTVFHANEEAAAETRLAQNGVTSFGEITAVVPVTVAKSDVVSRYRVYFRFIVPTNREGDTEHTGIGLTDGPHLPDTLQLEKLVTVRFLPDAPQIVQVVSPPLKRAETGQPALHLVLTLGIPLLCLPPRFAVWWWAGRRERLLAQNGLLVRATVVRVRRSGWNGWVRDAVTYRFRSPEGAEITARRSVYSPPSARSVTAAAVLYLNRKRYTLL